jgi:hypothetical protein
MVRGTRLAQRPPEGGVMMSSRDKSLDFVCEADDAVEIEVDSAVDFVYEADDLLVIKEADDLVVDSAVDFVYEADDLLVIKEADDLVEIKDGF